MVGTRGRPKVNALPCVGSVWLRWVEPRRTQVHAAETHRTGDPAPAPNLETEWPRPQAAVCGCQEDATPGPRGSQSAPERFQVRVAQIESHQRRERARSLPTAKQVSVPALSGQPYHVGQLKSPSRFSVWPRPCLRKGSHEPRPALQGLPREGWLVALSAKRHRRQIGRIGFPPESNARRIGGHAADSSCVLKVRIPEKGKVRPNQDTACMVQVAGKASAPRPPASPGDSARRMAERILMCIAHVKQTKGPVCRATEPRNRGKPRPALSRGEWS